MYRDSDLYVDFMAFNLIFSWNADLTIQVLLGKGSILFLGIAIWLGLNHLEAK